MAARPMSDFLAGQAAEEKTRRSLPRVDLPALLPAGSSPWNRERFRTRSRVRGFNVFHVNHFRLLIELARHLHRLAYERLGALRVVEPVGLSG